MLIYNDIENGKKVLVCPHCERIYNNEREDFELHKDGMGEFLLCVCGSSFDVEVER